MQKANYYFKPIFLTQDGFAFLDKNVRSKTDEINFQRYETDKDIKSDEDVEIELKKVNEYLKKNKLKIIPTSYFKTTVYIGIENNEKDCEQYFIFFIKSENKESLFPLGDVITDEKITWQDRFILSDYIQGKLINLLDPDKVRN